MEENSMRVRLLNRVDAKEISRHTAILPRAVKPGEVLRLMKGNIVTIFVVVRAVGTGGLDVYEWMCATEVPLLSIPAQLR